MADIIPTYFLFEQAKGNVDFSSDSFKWALFYGSYDSSFLYNVSAYSQIQQYEISAVNGYTTGGVSVSGSSSYDLNNKTVTYNCGSPSWICSGGSIGPFRYAALYDETASNTVVYFYDPSEEKTIEDGATLEIKINSGGLIKGQQRT